MRPVGEFKATPLTKMTSEAQALDDGAWLLGYEYDDMLQCHACNKQKYNVLRVTKRNWYCIECLATLIGTGRLVVRLRDQLEAQADPAETVVVHDDGTTEVGDITVAWK